jgi:uncharacterized membrane protein YdbT with pleckstrin-like domain
MPPSFINDQLATDEEVRLVAHRHWITLAAAVVGYLALFFILLMISGVGFGARTTAWGSTVGYGAGLGSIIFLVLLAMTVVNWYYRMFAVTTRRVMQVSGVLNRRVSDTNLDKVNDVVMTQSVLGRMLGYGTVQIISGSDVGVDSFDRIKDPVGFKRTMLDNKEDFDSLIRAAASGGRVTSPAQIEELAALRDQGLITPEEFEAKRAELLERL